MRAEEQFSYMKTPLFSRISQSDCNAEQCELFRTKNKRSQSMPVDGGPLKHLGTGIIAEFKSRVRSFFEAGDVWT